MASCADMASFSRFKKKIPNILTYSRIVAIPVLAIFFLNPMREWIGDDHANRFAALTFLYAGATDLLDGYLARIWEANTSLGKFLDPIADKLLVATCLMLLVGTHRADMLPALAILCREILVSGLREFLADLRVSVPVSKLAQYKTAIQMIAMYLLLIWDTGPWYLKPTVSGPVLLWISAALTLASGYAYLRTAIRHMDEN